MDASSNHAKANYLVLLAIILQIVFTVFIVASLLNNTRSDEVETKEYMSRASLPVSNIFEVFPDFTEDGAKELNNSLYEMAKLNNSEINLATEATIRSGTEHAYFFEKTGLNYYSAIVDIPNLEQSYRFFYEVFNREKEEKMQASGKERSMIICLNNEEDIIYPDFNCKNGSYDQSSLIYLVKRYLSQIDFDSSIARMDNNGNIKIFVYPSNSRMVPPEDSTVIGQVKDFIKSLGIRPDIFTFEVVNSGGISE